MEFSLPLFLTETISGGIRDLSISLTSFPSLTDYRGTDFLSQFVQNFTLVSIVFGMFVVGMFILLKVMPTSSGYLNRLPVLGSFVSLQGMTWKEFSIYFTITMILVAFVGGRYGIDTLKGIFVGVPYENRTVDEGKDKLVDVLIYPMEGIKFKDSYWENGEKKQLTFSNTDGSVISNQNNAVCNYEGTSNFTASLIEKNITEFTKCRYPTSDRAILVIESYNRISNQSVFNRIPLYFSNDYDGVIKSSGDKSSVIFDSNASSTQQRDTNGIISVLTNYNAREAEISAASNQTLKNSYFAYLKFFENTLINASRGISEIQKHNEGYKQVNDQRNLISSTIDTVINAVSGGSQESSTYLANLEKQINEAICIDGDCQKGERAYALISDERIDEQMENDDPTSVLEKFFDGLGCGGNTGVQCSVDRVIDRIDASSIAIKDFGFVNYLNVSTSYMKNRRQTIISSIATAKDSTKDANTRVAALTTLKGAIGGNDQSRLNDYDFYTNSIIGKKRGTVETQGDMSVSLDVLKNLQVLLSATVKATKCNMENTAINSCSYTYSVGDVAEIEAKTDADGFKKVLLGTNEKNDILGDYSGVKYIDDIFNENRKGCTLCSLYNQFGDFDKMDGVGKAKQIFTTIIFTVDTINSNNVSENNLNDIGKTTRNLKNSMWSVVNNEMNKGTSDSDNLNSNKPSISLVLKDNIYQGLERTPEEFKVFYGQRLIDINNISSVEGTPLYDLSNGGGIWDWNKIIKNQNSTFFSKLADSAASFIGFGSEDTTFVKNVKTKEGIEVGIGDVFFANPGTVIFSKPYPVKLRMKASLAKSIEFIDKQGNSIGTFSEVWRNNSLLGDDSKQIVSYGGFQNEGRIYPGGVYYAFSTFFGNNTSNWILDPIKGFGVVEVIKGNVVNALVFILLILISGVMFIRELFIIAFVLTFPTFLIWFLLLDVYKNTILRLFFIFLSLLFLPAFVYLITGFLYGFFGNDIYSLNALRNFQTLDSVIVILLITLVPFYFTYVFYRFLMAFFIDKKVDSGIFAIPGSAAVGGYLGKMGIGAAKYGAQGVADAATGVYGKGKEVIGNAIHGMKREDISMDSKTLGSTELGDGLVRTGIRAEDLAPKNPQVDDIIVDNDLIIDDRDMFVKYEGVDSNLLYSMASLIQNSGMSKEDTTMRMRELFAGNQPVLKGLEKVIEAVYTTGLNDTKIRGVYENGQKKFDLNDVTYLSKLQKEKGALTRDTVEGELKEQYNRIKNGTAELQTFDRIKTLSSYKDILEKNSEEQHAIISKIVDSLVSKNRKEIGNDGLSRKIAEFVKDGNVEGIDKIIQENKDIQGLGDYITTLKFMPGKMIDVLKANMDSEELLKSGKGFNEFLEHISNSNELENMRHTDLNRYLSIKMQMDKFRNLSMSEKIRLASASSVDSLKTVQDMNKANEISDRLTGKIVESIKTNGFVDTSNMEGIFEGIEFSTRDKLNLKRKLKTQLETVKELNNAS